MTVINHFISGAETAGRGTGTKPVYNPATGAVTAELRLANRDDLDTTVAISREPRAATRATVPVSAESRPVVPSPATTRASTLPLASHRPKPIPAATAAIANASPSGATAMAMIAAA
jgi:hypothetical protein